MVQHPTGIGSSGGSLVQEEAPVAWVLQLFADHGEPRQSLDKVPVNKHFGGIADFLSRPCLFDQSLTTVHWLGFAPKALLIAPIVVADAELGTEGHVEWCGGRGAWFNMVLHDDGSKNLYICKDPWESLTCEPLSMLGAMAARCQRGEWSTLSKYSPKLLLVVPDALCVDCDYPSANK